MSTIIEIAAEQEFTPLAANYYVITLVKYTVRERQPDQFHKEPFRDIEFDWSVEVPGAEPVERKSWCNIPKSWSEDSKLIKLVMAMGAINSMTGKQGFKFDLDKLLGHSCRGNIVQETRKKDGKLVDKIDDYAPLLPGQATAPRPVQPVPAPRPVPQSPFPAAPIDDDMVYDDQGNAIPF